MRDEAELLELFLHSSSSIIYLSLIFTLSLYFIAAFGFALIIVLIIVAVRSRRGKSGVGALELIGRVVRVEKEFEPEGAVLIDGELWRARARTGETISSGVAVRIVSARGHLLEVERVAVGRELRPEQSSQIGT